MANELATAADYADAMLVARRAKTWIFGLLMGMLLLQLAVFFVARYTQIVIADPRQEPRPVLDVETGVAATLPATAPAVANSLDPATFRAWLQSLLHYALGLGTFLGIVLGVLLALVLTILLGIMLVGRLIGVAPVMRALVGAWLLALLLFPWQAFLNNAALPRDEFKIPGVLATFDELKAQARFGMMESRFTAVEGVLKWARWVGFPLLAVGILVGVQSRSNRGLRLALGESEPASGSSDGTVTYQ